MKLKFMYSKTGKTVFNGFIVKQSGLTIVVSLAH